MPQSWDCKQLDQRFVLHRRYFTAQQTWVDGMAVESKPKERERERYGTPREEDKFKIRRSVNFIDVMWRPGWWWWWLWLW